MDALLHMKLVSKTGPFNAGSVVEMKFVIAGPYMGETYLRVPTPEAATWLIGDEYTLRLRRI